MTDGLCFLNEQWLPLAEAHLPLSDLSIMRGYAIFDYLRTYQRRPFHLLSHLHRLEASARQVHLTLPYSLEKITALIKEGIAQTSFSEVGIKLLLTAGVSHDHFFPSSPSCFCILITPLPSFPSSYHKQGLKVITTRLLRALPQVKSTCYLPALIALHQAKQQHADDALYVNAQEEILEGLTSNIFAVSHGCLMTPESEEILPGITRNIIKQCARPDIPVKIQPLPLAHLSHWDEMFMTSSNKEVMPIVAVDGIRIGTGKIGLYTQEMQRRFHLYTQDIASGSL